MELDVKLFGAEALACGRETVRIEVPDEASGEDVLRAVGEEAPELRSSLGTLRLAVNHEYVAPGDRVSPGDELAIIGLVSGG